MTKRTYLGAIAVATAAALLAGCGGGGTTPTTSGGGSGGSSKGKIVNTTISISLSTKSAQSVHGRKPDYVSFSTKGLEISWEAYKSPDGFNHTQACIGNPTSGGCVSPAAQNFVTAVSPGLTSTNISCGAAGTGGTYTCNVIVPTVVGYNDFQVSTWDAAPFSLGTANNGFGGSFAAPPTANMLSYAEITDQQVLGGSNNSFNFALHGVVHSVYLGLNPNTLIVGAPVPTANINPTAPTVSFYALDADGNTIDDTNTYVDWNGDPMTIGAALSQTNPVTPAGSLAVVTLNQPLGAANSCDALSANGGITNPSQNACTIGYDGGDIVSETITPSTSPIAVPATAVTLNFTRSSDGPITIPGEPALGTLSSGIGPNSVFLAAGRDGNMYLSNQGGSIYQISTGATPAVTNTLSPSGGGVIDGIVQGPDNQIWYANYSLDEVGAYNLQNSTFCTTGPPDGCLIPTTGSPNDMIVGPDTVGGANSDIWFDENTGGTSGEIAKVQIIPGTQSTPPTYQLTEYPMNGTENGPNQMTVGSDGYIWFTVPASNLIASMNPSTGVETDCATTLTTPNGIATGSDGKLYVAEDGANQRIDQFSVVGGGCVYEKSWATTLPAHFLSVGPDGSLYIAESLGGASDVGRISPSGQLTEFPYTAPGMYDIASGPDNRVWVSDLAAAQVYYFTP